MNRRLAWLAALAAVMAVTACEAPGTVDKAGSATIVVHLASIDHVNDNGQSFGPTAFVDELSKVSGGRITVQLDEDFHRNDPDAESALVTAIAAGDVDGGWPSSRAFAAAGITSLETIETPMLVTSYAAQKALASGPLGAELLETLSGSGVVGLGLAVGPLRRPFAANGPLLGPADWRDVRFRVFNSPIQAAAVEDLGAIPVNAGLDWISQVIRGQLRGGEFDIAAYAQNGLGKQAGYVTGNVVLWPKMFVVSFSRKRFADLNVQQQRWVQEAADLAVKASVDAAYDENTPAQLLCDLGVRFPWASEIQLAGIRAAFRPTVDRLDADPVNGPLLRKLTDVVATLPVDTIAVTGCDTDRSGAVDAIPATVSTLPPGTYRVQITESDLIREGVSNADGITGIWTLTVQGGTYEMSCHPLDLPGTDCGHEVSDSPLDVGDLRGSGHRAFFLYRADRLAKLTGCQLPPAVDEPGRCFAGTPYGATWDLAGDNLTFSDYVLGGPTTDNLTLKPWTKIS